MKNAQRVVNGAGWLVFAIAMVVYFLSAERSGSLWDCGEFILGAYKLQIVHPPGAPLFILIGRMFTWVADIVSDNPSDIAFSINLMSGLFTALGAMFVCWTTIRLGRLALVGRTGTTTDTDEWALAGAGIVAGLTTAFCVSIWFSAVEGEVYAMSTSFTTITLWGMVKWYTLPDTRDTDRWLLFTLFIAGLSVGIHLLSLLTFPSLAMLFYLKKRPVATWKGLIGSSLIGVAVIIGIQALIILGLPKLWLNFELLLVNSFGLPFHSGLIPTLLLLGAVLYFGLRYAHKHKHQTLQYILLGGALVSIAFSLVGVVMIRSQANPPVDMNDPSDISRLVPYLNREQYGERALLRGPHFASTRTDVDLDDRWGQVDDRYEVVDYRGTKVFAGHDKMLFPRMQDNSQGRPELYKLWMGLDPSQPLPRGRPNMFDNIKFFIDYQLGWMYWRYFMWNFSGRQNFDQGYYPWDKSRGHWITGIQPLDELRLGDLSAEPLERKTNKSRNKYYAIPFIFGLIGLFFHFRRRPKEAFSLLSLFIITGIGIIVYTNQPPNEPRERDYVLVGSFFTYAIWVGMAVLALYRIIRERNLMPANIGAFVATLLILVAPILMATQNFDDMSRRHLHGARDYASNFLNSVAENAIIFTYGDNDTYPLWYVQEVEGVRTDVRVVNLSLIGVDWYIDLLRRKINDSPPVKFTIPSSSYRGKKRNQVFYVDYDPNAEDPPMTARELLTFIGGDNPPPIQGGNRFESHFNSKDVYIDVDIAKVQQSGILLPTDTAVVSRVPFTISGNYLDKGEIAVMDIIASNLWERPIYFAVTSRQDRLLGLQDYMQNEGLANRIIPIKNQSEISNYGLGGAGRSAANIAYDNIMNKWKWGNFDTHDMFVDKSFMPSIQSMNLTIRRTAQQLLRDGKTEQAIRLADKYFEVFPEMNFPYDYRTFQMCSIYIQADRPELAKPYMKRLADVLAERMAFYTTLDEEVRQLSYSNDESVTTQSMQLMLREVQRQQDTELIEMFTNLFSPYIQIPSQ